MSATTVRTQAKTTSGFTSSYRGRPDYATLFAAKEDVSNLRGFLDDTGAVQISCSTRYIQMLCSELLRARAVSLTRIAKQDGADRSSQAKRMRLLIHEIKRLFKHQALFPSPGVKARFLALLAIDGSLCFDAACTDLLIEQEWRNFDTVYREQMDRPSYMQGSVGWENFLMNGAPGIPITPRKTEPTSAFQSLPFMASRIVRGYKIEERAILGYLRKSPREFTIAPARTTLLVDFDNPHPEDENRPSADLVHVGRPTVFRGNPFRSETTLEHDQNRSGPDQLEDLATVINRLDRHQQGMIPLPVALNAANAFSTISLRSFLPSDEDKQKTYIEEPL